MQSSHKNDSNDGRSEHNRGNNLPSNIPNGIEVERRLKKELLDLGLLDMNDFPKVNKYKGDLRICKFASLVYFILIFRKRRTKCLMR